MSKASQSSITATAPMPSRRRLLAGSGLAAVLGTIGLPVAAVAETLPDPVVALFAKWRATEDAIAGLDPKHTELRNSFVSQYGEMLKPGSDTDGWLSDPRRGELGDLTQAINDLCDESTALIDAMMETPATSLEGVRCKMIVGLNVWTFIEKPGIEAEYQDHMTVAFLRDAVRVLGGSTAA